MIQAAVDLGTNTFNLLIANRQSREVLYKEKQAVQLGKGGISKRVILEDAMDRAVAVLLGYKAVIAAYEVNSVVLLATSAVRNADNKTRFLSRVKQETGFDIRVLSGEEEAALIYEGVRQYLELGLDTELIVDIGGGSIEFIAANRDRVLWLKSLEIGAQRLMDKFHSQDPITSNAIDGLNGYLLQELDSVLQACRQHGVKSMVGSSGSFDTLLDIYHAKRASSQLREDVNELPIEYFLSICSELVHKPRAERLKIPGMIAMRVDMIVVASLLIRLLLETLGVGKLRVSAYALKEGVLFGNNETM